MRGENAGADREHDNETSNRACQCVRSDGNTRLPSSCSVGSSRRVNSGSTMQAKESHDQPFAIGSHRSCSFTSNSYANSRACASWSPLNSSMGSEFSGDFPPCSTSSFGGDADMMYMPAAGTVFYTPLARPSKIDRLSTSLAGAEGAMALQKLHRHAAPEDSGTGDYALPRPDLLAARSGSRPQLGGTRPHRKDDSCAPGD